MIKSIPLELIAPCGMNCNLCSAYLREEKYIVKCPGCRTDNQCPQFPCTRLRNLDKRYRTKYGMSMIENLNDIEKRGIRTFKVFCYLFQVQIK